MPDMESLQQIELPQTMKAIVVTSPNEDLSLSEIELPIPECRDTELLVKVEYVGLNPLDAHNAKSGYCDWQYPHVLGLDAVGVVVQAPRGIYPNVGDRVMWHANIADQGVLSEYAKVPNYAAEVVPKNVKPEQAATLPCAGMSALIALDKLQIKEGDTLLIEAGAGAVGQFAIQFANQRGADVYTTATKQNHKLVKCLGAIAAVDYQDKKMCEKICHEVGPQGFDAILDSVGGEATIRNLEIMRFCGRIACLQPLPELPQTLLFQKAPNISIVSLAGAWLANSICAQQHMSFMGKLLLDSVADNKICTPEIIDINFDAESVSAALVNQIKGGITGKQVVKVGSNR